MTNPPQTGWAQQPAGAGPGPYGSGQPSQQPGQQYPQQAQQPGQPPTGQQAPHPQYGQHAPHGYPQPYGQAGQNGVFSAKFVKHTGMLLLWQQSTRHTQGTFEQVAAAYKAAQTHCLLAGWWSISSALVFNWYAIFKNMYVYSQVKKQAGR